ncbi:hypothetical protein K8089_15990, partial [Aequorivita sp. F47161]
MALEQKNKTKYKRFGLWIIRKLIVYFQPYFFYTKRCAILNETQIAAENWRNNVRFFLEFSVIKTK